MSATKYPNAVRIRGIKLAIELNTTGPDANSFITLDEANIIISETAHPSIPSGFQLSTEQLPELLEAARKVNLWAFRGERTHTYQRLAWPRSGYSIPGKAPGPNWLADYPHIDPSSADLAYFVHFESPGLSSFTLLPDDFIPQEVKEAQAIIAALAVNGVTIWQDNKYDSSTVQLGPIKIDPVNTVAKADIVFERLGRWGTFAGAARSAPGGSRD